MPKCTGNPGMAEQRKTAAAEALYENVQLSRQKKSRPCMAALLLLFVRVESACCHLFRDCAFRSLTMMPKEASSMST